MSPHLEKFTSTTINGTGSYNGKSKLTAAQKHSQDDHFKTMPTKLNNDGDGDDDSKIIDQKRLDSSTTNQVHLSRPLDTAGGVGGTFNSFYEMLNSIETAFSRSNSSVDVDELWKVLENYKSNKIDWSRYAYYDMRKYKRNLVAEHDKYNVMILCWGPGTQSCIHDHSGAHCFMKILDGELYESRFAWPDQKQIAGVKSEEMCCLSNTVMHTDDVLYINDKVGLHLVGNPHPTKTAASLHVYIPPYRKCKAFDQRTGRAVQCELNFHSKCGRVVSED